jgi:hypothetical protein
MHTPTINPFRLTPKLRREKPGMVGAQFFKRNEKLGNEMRQLFVRHLGRLIPAFL